MLIAIIIIKFGLVYVLEEVDGARRSVGADHNNQKKWESPDVGVSRIDDIFVPSLGGAPLLRLRLDRRRREVFELGALVSLDFEVGHERRGHRHRRVRALPVLLHAPVLPEVLRHRFLRALRAHDDVVRRRRALGELLRARVRVRERADDLALVPRLIRGGV